MIRECERQALHVENLTSSLEAAHAEKATLSGQLREVEAERDTARQEGTAERHAAETARTELAKARLRLEAMPRLEKEIDELRHELESERQARFAAVQSAAVAEAKLEAAIVAKSTSDTAQSRASDAVAALRDEVKASQFQNAKLQAELVAALRPRPIKAPPRKPLKPDGQKKT